MNRRDILLLGLTAPMLGAAGTNVRAAPPTHGPYADRPPAWPGSVSRVGPRHLLIDVVDGVLREAVWRDDARARSGGTILPTAFPDPAAGWRVTSDAGPLAARRLTWRRYPEQASLDVESRAHRWLILMETDRTLAEGERLTVAPRDGNGTLALTVGDAARSHAVNAPHHGWTPGSPDKHAMVGLWFGPGVTTDQWLSSATRFGLIDARTGTFVTGWRHEDGHRLTLARNAAEMTPHRPAMNSWRTGHDVYEARFAAFDRPGLYRVAVEGLGASHPFAIDRDVHRPLMRHVARGFIHIQHDDGARRAAGVPAALAMPPTLRHMRFIATARTYASIAPDGIGDAGKLWARKPIPLETDRQLLAFGVDHPIEGVRDAADYDIRPQHLDVATDMIALSVAFPRFGALDMGRAEHGRPYDKTVRGERVRGTVPLPDAFHAALYIGDAWTRMQVDSAGFWQGAVRGGFDMRGYIGWRADFQSWARRFGDQDVVHLTRPDPWASFAYAGFAAAASVRFRLLGDRAMADIYAARAQAAWTWAARHEHDEDLEGWRPAWRTHRAFVQSRTTAAVAMWALTGQDRFAVLAEEILGMAGAVGQPHAGTAARLYLALAPDTGADPIGRDRLARAAVVHSRAVASRQGVENAVAFGRALHAESSGEWRRSLNLPYEVHLDHLTTAMVATDPALAARVGLDAGTRLAVRARVEAALSYTCGRNALGRAFITGFGADPPRSLHFADWKGLGLTTPAPGLIAHGLLTDRMLADVRDAEGYAPALAVTPHPLRPVFGESIHRNAGEFSVSGTLWPLLTAVIAADALGQEPDGDGG